MPRRGLAIEEALALFEELPSDGSDLSSELGDDEEFIPNFPDLEEFHLDDIPSEDVIPDIQSLPSTSRAEEIIWEKRDIEIETPDFSSRSGPSDEVLNLETQSPIALFLLIFSMQMIESIVFQTNLYATQMQKPFNPLEVTELMKFLGINLLMGIKHMPSYRDHWSSNPEMNDEFISKQMPIKRFSWILSHLHLNDNELQPKRGEPGFDKLYKLRPLLTQLSERFLSLLHPNEKQAVDESMVKFKGRSSLKQYMPKKPIKRGYKIWMRCDESGYACQFDIYTGKTDDLAEKNLGERVVKNLCTPIFGKNHKLFMDNYFTTYNLFRFLETQKIFCCGTVNMNRKNLPKNLHEEKNLQRGDFDFSVSSDNIVCIKWKDRRCVTVLSNQTKPAEVHQVQRKEKDGTTKNIACPKAIVDYNRSMGFVDHFDHLKSLYEIDRKSKKWWHRIFFHLLDMSVVNAYILYKMCHAERKSLKDFRLEIVTGLTNLGESHDMQRRRIHATPVQIKKISLLCPQKSD